MDWNKTLDVNLTAPFLTAQYFAKQNLAAQRPGRIININSQAAFHGSTTGHTHYAASKGGMTAMTISMARELSPKGITVNGIALGIVETDLMAEGIAKTEEVAGIAVFLASAPAAYLTGTTLDATGGMLMR